MLSIKFAWRFTWAIPDPISPPPMTVTLLIAERKWLHVANPRDSTVNVRDIADQLKRNM